MLRYAFSQVTVQKTFCGNLTLLLPVNQTYSTSLTWPLCSLTPEAVYAIFYTNLL